MGVTRAHFEELTRRGIPFVCQYCVLETNNAVIQQLQAEVAALKSELAEALAEVSALKSELAESTRLLKQDIRGCCLDAGGGGLMLQPQTHCLCVTK